MFDGLNALPWYDLKHAYGSAEEVPMWLRQLTSRDERIRQQAINNLGGSICHQGWICPATAYVVPYLIELLQEPSILEKEKILELLADIASASPELHAERWRKNVRVSQWNVPEHIPFKHAQEEVRRGLSTYLSLLDAPHVEVRMQAANVLKYVAQFTPSLWEHLVTRLGQETERKAHANLVLLLGALSSAEAETHIFFTELRQTDDDLIVFCAALALVRLAKDEAPQDVIDILAHTLIQPSEQLDTYRYLPCSEETSWRDAALGLGNLRLERLQSLAPAFQQALLHAETWRAMTLAEMLLFLFFFSRQSDGQQQCADFTPQQESILSLLCDRTDLWGSYFVPRLPDLLQKYALPSHRRALANILNEESEDR